MFDLLFIVSIIGTGVQLVKESFTPEIPSENWANKELYHKDIMDGVSIEQRMKNLKNGKYKLLPEESMKEKKHVQAERKYIYKL